MDTEPHDIMQTLKKYNQEHVLNFYDELTDSEKQMLINQIRSIDFEKMQRLYINEYVVLQLNFR